MFCVILKKENLVLPWSSSSSWGSLRSGWSLQTATLALFLSLTGNPGAVGRWQGIDLGPSVLGVHLALLQLPVHLVSNMVSVVVDHGKGDADREDGHSREDHG